MKTDNAAVDVVILTFGNFAGLERTINSVLAQTLPIRTVMLSDDGSGRVFPEETVDRLRKGPFDVVVRQGKTNLGTVAHANQAVGQLSGRYVKLMATGDAFADTQSLRSLVDFAKVQRTLVVTSDCTVCDGELQKRFYRFPGPRRGKCFDSKGNALFSALAIANVVSAAGTLIHRDFFTEYGGFDEAYHLLEDWPAWLRLSREGHSLPYLPRVTALYAIGGVSSGNSNAFRAPQLREDMALCYEKEIMPYFDKLTAHARSRVRYGYACVAGMPEERMRRTFPLQYTQDQVKRWLKGCITGR